MSKLHEVVIIIEKKLAEISDRVFRWYKIAKLLLLVFFIIGITALGVMIYNVVYTITHPQEIDIEQTARTTYESTQSWVEQTYERYAPGVIQKTEELGDRADVQALEWNATVDSWFEGSEKGY